MESTTISQEQELSKTDELSQVISGIKDLRTDLRNTLRTTENAEAFLKGPMVNITLTTDQKANLNACRHALVGVIDDIDDRFGRYL